MNRLYTGQGPFKTYSNRYLIVQVILTKSSNTLIADDCNSGNMRCEPVAVKLRAVADLRLVISKAKKKKALPPALKIVSSIDLTAFGAYRDRKRLNLRLCRGHHEAADLYQEILDPFLRKGKDGKPMVKNVRHDAYWWGRPRAKLAAKMGWTEEQVKYRLEQLRDFNLIATCKAKTPYDMLQVRPLVADGAAYLTGTPDASNYPVLNSESEPQSLTGKGLQPDNSPQATGQEFPDGHRVGIPRLKALGLEVGLKEVGLKDFAGQPLPATAAYPEKHAGEPVEVKSQTPKPTPSLKGVPLSPVPPPPFPASPVAGKLSASKENQALMAVFRKGAADSFGMYTGEPTKQHWEYVNRIRTRLTDAGFDPVAIVDWLLSSQSHWEKFARKINRDVDPKAGIPAKPRLEILATVDYLNVLVSLLIAKRESDAARDARYAAQSVAVIAPAPKVVKVEPTAEEKAAKLAAEQQAKAAQVKIHTEFTGKLFASAVTQAQAKIDAMPEAEFRLLYVNGGSKHWREFDTPERVAAIIRRLATFGVQEPSCAN